MRTRTLCWPAAILVSVTACFGDSPSGLRIERADLVRQVSAKYHAKTFCSRQSKDGSRWGCLVGDPPDPECYVVDVSPDGSWKTEDAPPACHYP
jgi:hypothetical protein